LKGLMESNTRTMKKIFYFVDIKQREEEEKREARRRVAPSRQCLHFSG